MTVEDVLKKDFVNGRNARVTVSFNKLVRTQEYESERVEAQLEFDLADDENAEMQIIEAQTELEFAVMTQLLAKRQISQEEFNQRKGELNDGLALMSAKLASLGTQITKA